MVSRDKIKNFLFLFGYFLLLFNIAFIFNIIAIRKKTNLKEEPFQLTIDEFKDAKEYFKNSKKKVKITFWHNLYAEERKVLNKIIQDFEKDYPGIEVLEDNKGNWGQIFKHVSNALTVDKQPNLVVSYPDHVGFYHKSNKVLPLDAFIDKDEDFKNNKQNDFLPYYFAPIQIEDKIKHYYYLPFLKTTEIMFYNKDLLKSIHDKIPELINDKGEIAKDSLSWVQMDEISKILKDSNKKDFIPIVVDSESNLFIISTQQKGINYPLTKEQTQDFLHNSEVQELLQEFKTRYDNKHLTLGKLTGEEDKVPELLINNNIAFYITSTRRLDNLCIDNAFIPKLGYTNVPTVNSESNKNILQGSNVNLFYSKNKDEMLASWFFLKHLTSEDVYKDFLKENKFFNITRQASITQVKDRINEIESEINKKLTDSNKEETNKLKLRKEFLEKFILQNANSQESQKNFFTIYVFENSDFFINIIADLFIEVLMIDKNLNDKDTDARIKELLTEAINRI
ncbi:ABC transporter substrate-binding protein [Candidatus Phytoplasma ziziphi]|uniref:ABC transporter substrate-binding protein n=1 Tax=Candidatus Phytoplasma TaxID=33926 RepID=UPI0013751A29|nr:extracellular solute-binding protein [Candidatus Phytoplasma ziziphi]